MSIFHTGGVSRGRGSNKNEVEVPLFTHIIKLWEKANYPEPMIVEEFTGTDLEAEQRLSEVWNDSPAALTGERYKAHLHRVGERKCMMSIG